MGHRGNLYIVADKVASKTQASVVVIYGCLCVQCVCSVDVHLKC